MKKNVDLKIDFSKFIVKPIFATFIMSICSYTVYILLKCIISIKIATIISILSAIFFYAVSIIILKIFSKEEMLNTPYGSKIYRNIYKDKF